MMKPSIDLELILNYQMFNFSWLSHHRDGKMPVSFIQKYLVKKLDLGSETEVSSSLFKFVISTFSPRPFIMALKA